jgi:molybdopterin-containing oxidoreductase family iron-sulfur binding subunit
MSREPSSRSPRSGPVIGAGREGGLEHRSGPVIGAGREGGWRSLEELAGDPAFQERLFNEFPSQVEAITDPVERRVFLKLMGASLGLAGVTACTRQPVETIVPYVRQPEEVVPGKPLFYATAMTLAGVGTGLLVESHEGRPTKIEGNPDHPSSLGATSIFAQAAILDLYDPDRSRALTNLGEIRPWADLLAVLRNAATAQESRQGGGIRILSESVSSPTLAGQIQDLMTRLPGVTWHRWDPAVSDNVHAGTRLAFGEAVDPHYRFDQADVILSFDCDFLCASRDGVRYSREFSRRRRPDQLDRMNRLYAIESMPSLTGSKADHRYAVRPGAIHHAAIAIARACGVNVPGDAVAPSGNDAINVANVAAIAKDLAAHRGTSLVVAGDGQPAAVHALAHAINERLGNIGRTIVYTDPVEASPVDHRQSIAELTREMAAGQVDVLIVLGGNPVYTAPADLKFGDALERVPLRVHLGSHEDETSERCHWQIPEAHFLEAWSDVRAYDGTVSIVQPLIAPLYGSRTAHEVIAAFSETPDKAPYDLVREHWMKALDPKATEPTPAFESAWREWLHDGIAPDTAFAPRTVTLSPDALTAAPAPAGGFAISFHTDPSVLDGRFANNGWLQELPKPITKLTWDNAVFVSPATAAKLLAANTPAFTGGEHGQIVSDLVELRYKGRSIRGPLFPVVGHPDECATVHLGYGRRRGGRLASGAGFDAYAIRSAEALWFDSGAELVKTGERYSLACTQYHHMMEGRGMIHAATREEFAADPHVVHEGFHVPPRTLTLLPEYPYEGYKWGMAIDVHACTGCNACIVGCQAENNIPIVGKDQVLRGREMHWLRVDTYYSGEAADPQTYFQPIPCMQCENAPCEVVCPVGATVHSHEGLNDMVYNRCVGTRYCANNCPYKVRRFNYLLYQDWNTESLKLGRNPDITIRSRGVMEKCTYCVQRINEAKIESDKQDRKVRDGEIKTACEAACPAEAIVFGDLNDPNSRVSRLQKDARNYSLLDELNTRPRTTYLAVIRNVNPEAGE